MFVALRAALCRDVFTLADLKDDETNARCGEKKKSNTWLVSYIFAITLEFLDIT